MTKRIAVLGLVGAALLALSVASQAHWVYTLAGWRYHSVICDVALAHGNAKEGVTIRCDVKPSSIATVYCAVPGNDFTFAGQAAVNPVSVTNTFAPGELQKASGNTYLASITAFDPNLQDFVSACPNPNWRVVAVVLNNFDSEIFVTDAKGVPATHVAASCALPPQFATTPPPSGTQYVCNVTAEHLS